jgi:hypothetical protein
MLEQSEEYAQQFSGADDTDVMDGGVRNPQLESNERGRLDDFANIDNGLFWIWDSMDTTAGWP